MPEKNFYSIVTEEVKGKYVQSYKLVSFTDLPDNDVLVRVHYSSLNYKDALSATGHKGITKSYPFTPGIDAAGVVKRSRDSRFSEGDEVIVTSYDLGMNTPGGFGQYISVPGDWIIPLPESLTLKQSMMIGTSGLTAAMGADKILRMNISPGDGAVLVTGATGAVGSFAVTLLSHLGFHVTAATSKINQKAFLSKLGASAVIHRDEITNVDNKLLLSGKWSAVFDTVGGHMLDCVLRQTAHNGVVACCGNVLGNELHTNILPFILRGVTLMGIDSGIALIEDRQRIWTKLGYEWKPPTLRHLYKEKNLKELPEEISRILKGEQKGKILINLK